MTRKLKHTALFAALLLTLVLPLSGMARWVWTAAVSPSPGTEAAPMAPSPTPEAFAPMPGDTLDDVPPLTDNRLSSGIIVLARSYGDSIVLRWSGHDYPTMQALYDGGVDVVRYDYATAGGVQVDTLVQQFKPWTQQQFTTHYPQTDSVAYMAIGLLYSDKELRPDQTESAPGTFGSLMAINEDQKQRMAFTLLVSEWRKDLADHMALRWVDRNVTEGHEYEYVIRPCMVDTTGHLPITPGVLTVQNKPYVKEALNVQMGDSVVGPHKLRLWWEDCGMSSFEIERRKVGETQWTRRNSMPFLNMTTVDTPDGKEPDCVYGDIVEEPGYYEYRIMGHDAFGELTDPSPILRTYMPDLSGPLAPELFLVEIDRQDPNDLSKQVMATFHFRKDSIEQDFTGFMPMYYSAHQETRLSVTEEGDTIELPKTWKNLAPSLLSPTDSTYTCDVTGLSTGMVIIAAYDTAQNVSYSLPHMIQIQDVKAPAMMRHFKAEPHAEDGTVTLTWQPDSLDDDIEYYEVLSANDTTHSFVVISTKDLRQPQFTDTLAMDVNQKYIYYKVRAIDYSTNQGVETPALRVLRPTRLVPAAPHLLSSAVDSTGIHMTWSCSNEQVMDRHILMRRLQGQKKWEVLGIFKADSINAAGNVLQYTDKPPYNRKRDYQYCMESFSYAKIPSGPSIVLSVSYEGPRIIHVPLRLTGSYDAERRKTILRWEVNDGTPLRDTYHVSLYRKGPHDDTATFFLSMPSGQTECQASTLHAGEQEQWFAKIRFKDGRESQLSNIVFIKAE